METNKQQVVVAVIEDRESFDTIVSVHKTLEGAIKRCFKDYSEIFRLRERLEDADTFEEFSRVIEEDQEYYVEDLDIYYNVYYADIEA